MTDQKRPRKKKPAILSTPVLKEFAEALHNISIALRDTCDIQDELTGRVVDEIGKAVAEIGDAHGDPVMIAALLAVTASALEGMADPVTLGDMS